MPPDGDSVLTDNGGPTKGFGEVLPEHFPLTADLSHITFIHRRITSTKTAPERRSHLGIPCLSHPDYTVGLGNHTKSPYGSPGFTAGGESRPAPKTAYQEIFNATHHTTCLMNGARNKPPSGSVLMTDRPEYQHSLSLIQIKGTRIPRVKSAVLELFPVVPHDKNMPLRHRRPKMNSPASYSKYTVHAKAPHSPDHLRITDRIPGNGNHPFDEVPARIGADSERLDLAPAPEGSDK